MVTCPACGRKAAVAQRAREVLCDCGRRFDPAARPTVADPFLGKTLSGYRIEEVLGNGGMGTVYKAVQESLGRPVALKVLPPNVADDPQFVGRFHREAEVLASLNHPNIVQVFDRGEVDGRYFIVMEFVDGESLREFVRCGRVPAQQACRIVASLLAALDYAHEKGVVHRDIKPENVLVRADGVVKVADFGLSRVLGADEFDTRLTRTHLVLGTYEYMAPEQREAAREADARSDIYATAVVLYEMLTGELPIGRFRLPAEQVPGLDRRIDRVLDRGLAKDPDDRWDRASAMGRAIESLLTSPGAPVDLAALEPRAPERPRKPKSPTAFEMRLDLLLTILSVCGLLCVVVGVALLVGEEDLEIGAVDMDESYGGALLGVFGLLLWNAAERARRYFVGARTTLLTLTALAVPTVVGIPLMVWTWLVLLWPSMRLYCDARARGLDPFEAAALAQGMDVPERDRPELLERQRAASAANRRAAILFAGLAGAAFVAWTLVAPGKATRDEGAFLLGCLAVLVPVAAWFALLANRVRRGAWLHFNASFWTLLGVFAPRTARRARMLARDHRDGLV